MDEMDDVQAKVKVELPMGYLMALVAGAAENIGRPWSPKCQEAALLIINCLGIDQDTEDEQLQRINEFFVYIGTRSVDNINTTKTHRKNARTKKGKKTPT